MKIGIIVDTEVEAAAFIETLGEPNAKVPGVASGFSFCSWDMKYSPISIYLTASGIGSIEAANATQHLIDLCNVDKIYSCGYATRYSNKCPARKFCYLNTVYYYDDVYNVPMGIEPDQEIIIHENDKPVSVTCASDRLFIDKERFLSHSGLNFGLVDIYDTNVAGVVRTCNRNKIPVSCAKYLSTRENWLKEAQVSSKFLAQMVKDTIFKT